MQGGFYETEASEAPEAKGYGEQYYRSAFYDNTDYRISRLALLARADLGIRILDLGCGPGAIAVRCAVLGSQVYGVDISKAALKLSAQRAREVGVRLALFEFDGRSLPFRDSSFNSIIMADVAEHIDDKTLSCLLRESSRLLLPGGRLVLHTAPALEAMRISGLIRKLTLGALDLQSRLTTPEYEHLHIRYHSQKSITSLLKQSGLDPIVWGEVEFLKDRWPWPVQKTLRRLLADQVWALAFKGDHPPVTFPEMPYLDAIDIPADLNMGRCGDEALGGGFYAPEEGSFRWTGKEAVFYLKAREGCSRITMQAAAPHPDLASKPVQVDIYLDCRKVAAFSQRDPDRRTFSFDLPGKLRPGLHKIRLVVDRTFTPMDWGINQDPRALGIIFYSAKVD